MKRRSLLFLAVCMLLAVCAAFSVACSCNGETEKAEYDFTLNTSTCRLSWKEEKGVTYEVSEDKITWIQLERARVNLLDVVTKETTTKIYVRSYSGNKRGGIAEYPITVSALGVPGKPTAYLNETTYERGFVWDKVQGADQYQVRITTDGVQGNWINASGTNTHIITASGEHRIQVRCKGFFEKDVLMIPVNASDISDSIYIYQAPTLRVPDIDRVTWTSGSNFDSYNLAITDALGKTVIYENVVISGVDLDLVKEGYITRTGEYDLQVIGVKDGEFYGSNIEKQFGTSNINSHEIYSFDNRKFNSVQEQPGVSITDEQYVGKTYDAETNVAGYSLKFDGTDPDLKGQMNLIQYATNSATEIPVEDWRDITQVRFSVYVPSEQKNADGETVIINTFPKDIVYLRYETLNKSETETFATEGYYVSPYTMYYTDIETPTDTWVEFTLDCEIPYSNVLLLMNNFGYYGYVGYVDEIVYTKTENRSETYNAREIAPEDTEFIVSAGRNSVLTGYHQHKRTEINLGSEYAGKTVTLEFSVKGTVKKADAKAGFLIFSEPNYDKEGERAPIDANGNGIEGENYLLTPIPCYIGEQGRQTEEWKSYFVENVRIPENGIIWLDAFADWGTSNHDGTFEDEFNLYIKSVTVWEFEGIDYALEYSSESGAWSNPILTTIIDLGRGNAGKTVNFSMMVCGTANAEGEEKLGFNVYRSFAIPRAQLSTMEWSEVTGTCTLDENGQWNVSACCWGEPLESYYIYVKDVTVTLVYDYKLDYTGAEGRWFNDNLTAIDFGTEYANKTIAFTMDVCGNADSDEESNLLGLIASDKSWISKVIDRSYISTTATWTAVTGTWTLDGEGKLWTSACDFSGKCEAYSLYIKNANVELVFDYALEYSSESGAWSNPTLTTIIDLGSGYANKTLAVSMMVCGTANAEGEEKLGFNVYRSFAIPRAKLSTMTWSEVTGTCTLDENGQWNVSACCWGEPLESYCIYVKDVTYEPYYTVHFVTNGGDEISDVQIPVDTSLVNFDTTYATSKSNAFFDGWYLTSTFNTGTRVGTDITSIPVNGNYEFTVYAKWDNYTTFAQFYWITGENIGSYFGGQAAQIVLDGCEVGNKVEITMKVKTALDGTEDASIRLYQTYEDTQWIASDVVDGYWGGVELNPATESGWRQVKITVELKQDGYVWLAVANETPELGQCFVYIKDITVTFVYDYKLDYTGEGGWYNNTLTAIDFGTEYANKTVTFTMDVCGTADPDKETNMLGLMASDFSWLGLGIDRSYISTTATWTNVTGTWTLDESGKMWTSIGDLSGNCEPYSLYIKDITVTFVYDYKLDYTGEGGWYNNTLTAIDFGTEYANKTVTFTMDVCGTADPDKETNMLGLMASDFSWLGLGIDRSYISTTATWTNVTGTWTLDESGKMWTSIGDLSGNCEPYSLYIKDITVTLVDAG